MAICDKRDAFKSDAAYLALATEIRDALLACKNAKLDAFIAQSKTKFNVADLATLTAPGVKAVIPALTNDEALEFCRYAKRSNQFHAWITESASNGDFFTG